MTAHYGDTFREVGWGMGFTFPNLKLIPFPLARLDYVFHNDYFQGVAARVWPSSGGSDHRPLYVELALIAPEN